MPILVESFCGSRIAVGFEATMLISGGMKSGLHTSHTPAESQGMPMPESLHRTYYTLPAPLFQW